MTIKQLKELIDRHPEREDNILSIVLSSPSAGPIAQCSVENANFGIDWDNRHLLLNPSKRLVEKKENEDLWDLARDLIFYIATKRVKKETYEIRRARRILEKINIDYKKYQDLFHGKRN